MAKAKPLAEAAEVTRPGERARVAMQCGLCFRVVAGEDLRTAVLISRGYVHRGCYDEMWRKQLAHIERAVREGTHTRMDVLAGVGIPEHMCDGCRQVRPIAFRTLDGKELCDVCGAAPLKAWMRKLGGTVMQGPSKAVEVAGYAMKHGLTAGEDPR